MGDIIILKNNMTPKERVNDVYSEVKKKMSGAELHANVYGSKTEFSPFMEKDSCWVAYQILEIPKEIWKCFEISKFTNV